MGRVPSAPGSHPSGHAASGVDGASRFDPSRGGRWIAVRADAALYVDFGRDAVACDRLPRPVVLLLKNPACVDGAYFPSAVGSEFPTSLADRGGASAILHDGAEGDASPNPDPAIASKAEGR